MKKILYIIPLIVLNIIFMQNVHAEEITYSSHVQNVGWQNPVKNGEISGTIGRGLRLEAIKINLSDYKNGSIEYQTHVQNVGWQNPVKNGEMSGTTGRSLRLEAIKINLTGELKEEYDLYYRTHVQNVGWTNFVKNGEMSGTTGRSLRLEALEIRLIKKGYNTVDLSYSTNVDSVGWQNSVNNGEISGTTGESKSIKGIKINLLSNVSGNIEYQTYYNYSLSNVSLNGTVSGNNSNKIEAIKIYLTGELANIYDIYYKVHVANVGWMDYVKNGTLTGTKGYFYGIEAIEIKLVSKVDNSVTTGTNYYKESRNTISYSSHVKNKGWMNYVNEGQTSGTTGQSLSVEAVKLNLDSKIGSIQYKTNVFKKGFGGYVSNNNISGTTGQSLKLEAIQIKLTGNIANYYDIYYRTHVSNIGWLGWAKNDEKSGSVGNGTQIEALEIKLVKKGASAPGSTSNKYVTGKFNNNYYYNYFGTKVTGWQWIDGIRYYFNSSGKMMGKNVKKVVDVSSWQPNINWDTVKSSGDIDAVILRVGWGMSYNDAAGTDSTFDYNIKAVQRLGIPYSIYIYAYAKVTNAAEKEASFVNSMMNKYNIPKSTFVWYDAEEGYSKSTYDQVVPAFINKMKSFGYSNVGLYGSLWNLEKGNLSGLRNYPIWVAQYNSTNDYSYSYKGWQYTSTGKVSGYNGNVDISMFK